MDKRMDKISNIINEWDPIGLFPMAPEDEYEEEIKKIKILLQQSDLEAEQIAQGIQEIFIAAFGDDVFRQSKENCMKIAKTIIDNDNV